MHHTVPPYLIVVTVVSNEICLHTSMLRNLPEASLEMDNAF